jgi:hypothetical protein
MKLSIQSSDYHLRSGYTPWTSTRDRAKLSCHEKQISPSLFVFSSPPVWWWWRKGQHDSQMETTGKVKIKYEKQHKEK